MGITIFRLLTSGLLPVLCSAGLYLAERKTRFGRCSAPVRQAVTGILFGALAVLSTEFGIPLEDATLNVRDAAPLTAGLIFGWPAGLIAGVIGGVERWFAALWGAGKFTRLACSLATVVAGIFGASVRKFMMDNRKASWFYGLAVGITTEVLHMLLVFLTNIGELQRAFSVVQRCAVPMILANGLSVMLSIIAVSLLGGKHEQKRHRTENITQSFQRWLLICVLLAFSVTTIFTYYFHTRLSSATASYTLKLNLSDVCQDIQDASDENLLSVTRQIAKVLPEEPELERLVWQYDVAEINLIDESGVIVDSTCPEFIGYDMAGGEQSSAFLPLLSGVPELVQDYQPTTFDPSLQRKYAGVALAEGGFLQVGYDASHFQQQIRAQVENAAKNRHIGQKGCIIICDESWRIISDRDGHEGESVSLLGYDGQEFFPANTAFTARVYDSSAFCMYTQTEGYYVIAVLPESEALLTRNVSVYILAFMETLVFAALFAHIYFLIKKLVVENIRKINSSLARITGGDLSVTVDVRTNEEFASLSDDINSTVTALKHYIDEAEARIDKELAMAKAIQHAALPSVFPPYPGRREFSIYATMDAAKEVGGDFYDFYLPDQDHLAFLVADVSGKGIPAAMFMMTVKTRLKSLAESGLPVEEVFTRANASLCENNDAGMFVTAWMGILDLKTGLLEYANAGHNPPLLRSSEGGFRYLRTRPNLVLAAMDGVRYRKQTLQLAPGDVLFLYTDGVTEAQNAEQTLYGEDRLQQCLSRLADTSVEAICRGVKEGIVAFVGEADQFDDITMLALHYEMQLSRERIALKPSLAAVEQVSEFLDQWLEPMALPGKAAARLKVAADEIYSNIVRYSGATWSEVCCRQEAGSILLTFRDNGRPWNPLEAREPDIISPAEERPMGGLGIHLVRNMMDRVSYRRLEDQNQLTLELKPD